MADGYGCAGLDIDRTAGLLVQVHGSLAVRLAALRANRLAEEGDRDGAFEWLRISEAVVALLKSPRQ
jgi:hypothetical protein